MKGIQYSISTEQRLADIDFLTPDQYPINFWNIHIQSLFKNFWNLVSDIHPYPNAKLVKYEANRQQRWPESLFLTPTPLRFQNFLIRARQIFKFENPTPVQTPATIIDPTVTYPSFYLRNDHTDSCYCRNWNMTPVPGPVFPKFLTPHPGPIENAESSRSRFWHSGSGPTSDRQWL